MANADGQSVRASVMEQAKAVAGDFPTPQLRSLVCPYCGTVTPDSGRCADCAGRFDALSRQATQNQMGPWSIRDDRQPHRPGCTFDTIERLIRQDSIGPNSVLRGPTTRQFWTLARHTPGVAHLLELCYSCQSSVKTDAFACPNCHASFSVERDRQHLGLGPARPLPGQGLPQVLAMKAEPAAVLGAGRIESSTIVGGTPNERLPQQPIPPQSTGQFTEASQLARRWKRAWELERRRAWSVISIAFVIVFIAIAYSAWIAWQSGADSSISVNTHSSDSVKSVPKRAIIWYT